MPRRGGSSPGLGGGGVGCGEGLAGWAAWGGAVTSETAAGEGGLVPQEGARWLVTAAWSCRVLGG